MIKSDSQTAQANKQDSTNQECWHNEANMPAIRFEMTVDRAVILPYQHLLSVNFEKNSEGDLIELNFTTHIAAVRGKGLFPLLIGIQKQNTDWVRTIPDRYRELLKNKEEVVSAIDVQSIQSGVEDLNSGNF
jgi:hypothetical protein